ncbi:MAG: hypothetical protein GY832_21510 [Chloroflexi bacterium]|nr:hypothetical protein [Chloroflexota bacterium]
MRAEGLNLGFSSGEQWGGGEDHYPQTANHRDKANPSTAITSLLVVTDNVTHRPRPKGTSQCTTWTEQGETARERIGIASAAEVMGRSDR